MVTIDTMRYNNLLDFIEVVKFDVYLLFSEFIQQNSTSVDKVCVSRQDETSRCAQFYDRSL